MKPLVLANSQQWNMLVQMSVCANNNSPSINIVESYCISLARWNTKFNFIITFIRFSLLIRLHVHIKFNNYW